MDAPANHVSLLAQAIKARRIERYLTQQELAQALTEASEGAVVIDRSAISRWESGDTQPSLKHRGVLVDVLEIPASFFLAAAA